MAAAVDLDANAPLVVSDGDDAAQHADAAYVLGCQDARLLRDVPCRGIVLGDVWRTDAAPLVRAERRETLGGHASVDPVDEARVVDNHPHDLGVRVDSFDVRRIHDAATVPLPLSGDVVRDMRASLDVDHSGAGPNELL